MIPLNLDSLKEFLSSKKFEPELQKETNQLFLIFKHQGKEFPLFLRVFEGENLLQILVFIPCTLKKEYLADTARLLHYLNKELDIPGFGVDEVSSLIFYRVMLPSTKQSIDEEVLETLLNSIQTICQTFSPVIATVSSGVTSFDDVLKKVSANQSNLNK